MSVIQVKRKKRRIIKNITDNKKTTFHSESGFLCNPIILPLEY